jgi:polyisoprenoid-binding protein YceI
MKKIVLVCLSAILVAGLAFAGSKATSMKLNAAKSSVKWEGKKVTGSHNGMIKVSNGTLSFTDGKLSGGDVTIDMTSIVCEDIKDAEYNKKFIGHMASEDFFNIEKHKTATLKIKSVTMKGNTAEIKGMLTIKGITKEVSFNAETKNNGGNFEAMGKITIDRTDFDIRYGSKKFFESIGDKMIYDEFTLDFNVVASK